MRWEHELAKLLRLRKIADEEVWEHSLAEAHLRRLYQEPQAMAEVGRLVSAARALIFAERDRDRQSPELQALVVTLRTLDERAGLLQSACLVPGCGQDKTMPCDGCGHLYCRGHLYAGHEGRALCGTCWEQATDRLLRRVDRRIARQYEHQGEVASGC